MNTTQIQPAFELCFASLFGLGHSYSFPCDNGGQVDMDSLSERARENYLYARALIGRHYAWPRVQPRTLQ